MKIIKLFIILNFIIIFNSCEILHFKENRRIKNDIKLTKKRHIGLIIKQNRDSILNENYRILYDSLKNNHMPTFIYDECLDANKSSYCEINSEVTVSLRFDLINKLPKTLIENALAISDTFRLKELCKIPFSHEMRYHDVSTLDMFKMALNKR